MIPANLAEQLSTALARWDGRGPTENDTLEAGKALAQRRNGRADLGCAAVRREMMNGIEGIEWTGDSVRSDIAADPEARLLAVGFLGSVPVVTAEAFRRYVENWMMGPGTVIEADGALIHDSYTERYVFPVVGMVGAVPVYALVGYGDFER